MQKNGNDCKTNSLIKNDNDYDFSVDICGQTVLKYRMSKMKTTFFVRRKHKMESIKKNPLLMGLLSALGCAALLLGIDFVISLIKGKPFSEQISDTISIIILIVGPVSCFVQTYMKTKQKVEGTDKKEM